MINSFSAEQAHKMMVIPNINEQELNSIFESINIKCCQGENRVCIYNLSIPNGTYLARLGYEIKKLDTLYTISW